MNIPSDWIVPEWPAPAGVRAISTVRKGGVSLGCFASLNLADHVGDDPGHVAANRALLRACLPAEPLWLRQVHGIAVADAGASACGQESDAAIARSGAAVCAVMTADCLPVLFCDESGSVVAAAHAGWRGLASGVLEATVRAMRVQADTVMAWLGPAIGPGAFEVGDDVRSAFIKHDPMAGEAFAARDGKWLADLYRLARLRLAAVGVMRVYGGGLCTYTDAARFFSYRRDGETGRMASLIWLK